jgi:chemotaxis protein methyltransferase CheR
MTTTTFGSMPYDITDKEFKLFQEIIYRHTGIHMSDKKRNLIVARLSKRLRALKLTNFSDYYEYLTENSNTSDELINLINRITTNKTDFFREIHHFDFLSEEIFPAIIRDSKERKLRIWSAGCSTGEEPYSLAMIVSEAFRNEKGWDIKILATDLDTEVLMKAAAGVYPSQVVTPVPINYLSKYFERTSVGYEVTRNIKSMVAFRKLNLMDPAFPMKKAFDIIFCRNVMIYFDEETKFSLINKFHHHLKGNGYMFVGHSESLMHMKDIFKFLKHTVYQKV